MIASMIRFESHVRIAYMSCPLVELLAAAGFWSVVARVDLVFSGIHDPTIDAGTCHGFALTAQLATEGSRPADLKRLHGWLTRALAPAWRVGLAPDHIRAEWQSGRGSHPRTVAARAAM
jgi:hypothetical protein